MSPRLSRSPPPGPRGSVPPLQRSLSQHLKPCTSSFVRPSRPRLPGPLLWESCCSMRETSSQEGAHPFCWYFTRFPVGKTGGAWHERPQSALSLLGSSLVTRSLGALGHPSLCWSPIPPPPREGLWRPPRSMWMGEVEAGWRVAPAKPTLL